jgi:hypothetical protein
MAGLAAGSGSHAPSPRLREGGWVRRSLRGVGSSSTRGNFPSTDATRRPLAACGRAIAFRSVSPRPILRDARRCRALRTRAECVATFQREPMPFRLILRRPRSGRLEGRGVCSGGPKAECERPPRYRIWCARCSGIGAALPLPLAGEGWGGGASASGLPGIAENVPARREPSPAALCERVGLSRKRERRSKLAGSCTEIHTRSRSRKGAEVKP